MNCERAQPVLSARMDGERVAPREARAALEHARTCPRCTAFSERAARVRSAVRIRPAEAVPDLVGSIMSAVATEAPPVAARRMSRRPAALYRPRHRRAIDLAPVAAAAIVGLLVGSVLVGGPWQQPADRPIAVAAVVRHVRSVAPALDAFQATYTIVERGLSPDVQERRLEMQVAFSAPQRFRIQVRDLTRYPSRSWTRTDLLYVQDLTRSYVRGPSGCPGDLPPDVCPRTRATVARLSRFTSGAPLATDLILPVTTFGSADGVEVIGTPDVAGRHTVQLEMSFARAESMFAFRRLGGTWRPFFERDRVVLWLDARTWLPLRWVVTPSPDPERREWELRYGLPIEPADDPILDVRLTSSSTERPDADVFRIRGTSQSRVRSLDRVAERIGYVPVTPADVEGLSLASAVVPASPAAATPRTLVVFADGLDYLKVGERRDWSGPGPFGPVDEAAERVELSNGGVAYYEPAGEGFGRRVSIHAEAADLFLETNLPRARLLAIAASLPVRGEPLPPSWGDEADDGLRRIAVDEALALAGLSPSVVDALPSGYVVASAVAPPATASTRSVTMRLRRLDIDAGGGPLTLHVERGVAMPPPSSATQSRMRIGDEGPVARWTAARSQLEWILGDTYHSLQGDVDVRSMLAIAAVVTEARA